MITFGTPFYGTPLHIPPGSSIVFKRLAMNDLPCAAPEKDVRYNARTFGPRVVGQATPHWFYRYSMHLFVLTSVRNPPLGLRMQPDYVFRFCIY